MMKPAIFAIATGVMLLSSSAWAQTAGIGTTKTAYTSQAGAAISKVVSQKTKYQLRQQPFGGSSVYVPLTSSGKLEFALANELETHFAVTGTAIYKGKPQPGLQVAMVLTPFKVGMWSRKGSNIKTVADLKGKRVPSGWATQKIIGVLMNGYLANGGLTYSDVVKVPVPNVVKSADEFAAGKADVFFFVTTAGKVKETDAKQPTQFIGLDPSPAAMQEVRKHVPVAYAGALMPAKNMVGVFAPTYAMAYDYLMLTNAKVSEDLVYQVAKAMHDNKADLVKSFRGLAPFNPNRMTKPLSNVQYHAGAIKYYKEIGQWPPK
ncbi:MAG: TAXI family TRAP transporter solute-binding subunit [Rhodospirillales bacterium]|nr:TAXI family TRAP transporter solute-binding subunit [Rhodospirillales bacterium]